MHGSAALTDDKAYIFMVSREGGGREKGREGGKEGGREGGRESSVNSASLPTSNVPLPPSPSLPSPLFPKIVLVLAGKTLLLPVLAFFCVSLLGGGTDLAIFAFLVGAFPVGE